VLSANDNRLEGEIAPDQFASMRNLRDMRLLNNEWPAEEVAAFQEKMSATDWAKERDLRVSFGDKEDESDDSSTPSEDSSDEEGGGGGGGATGSSEDD
jgi:hypothetical protein